MISGTSPTAMAFDRCTMHCIPAGWGMFSMVICAFSLSANNSPVRVTSFEGRMSVVISQHGDRGIPWWLHNSRLIILFPSYVSRHDWNTAKKIKWHHQNSDITQSLFFSFNILMARFRSLWLQWAASRDSWPVVTNTWLLLKPNDQAQPYHHKANLASAVPSMPCPGYQIYRTEPRTLWNSHDTLGDI